MDAKITKKRLGLLLSYDWIKIVAICVAAVAVWLVLFTTIATKASDGQTFEIYAYIGVRLNSGEISLDELHDAKALSNDVLDFSTYSLTDDGYQDMVLQVHFSAGQGDVIFVADTADTVDDAGNVTAYGGLRDFLYTYQSNSLWLGTDLADYTATEGEYEVTYKNYFAQCEEYLNGFFFTAGQPDYENGTLDEEIAEARFRERIRKDKRYKKESEKAAAVQGEFERLNHLRDSYLQVKEWVTGEDENAPVRVRTCNAPADTDGDKKISAGEGTPVQFAFDLSNLENITELAGNRANTENMAEGLCLVPLNTGSSSEEDMRYETFTLLTYLAEKYDA